MDVSCLSHVLSPLFFDPDKVIPQHDNGAAIAIRDNPLHPLSGSQKVTTMEVRSLI